MRRAVACWLLSNAVRGIEDDRRWFADSLRVGASPEVAYALNRAFAETDLTDVLPAVRVPTLVLYLAGDTHRF